MALFNDDNLKNKLVNLNMSQQSIQTLSLWLIHNKKHANTVVNVWFKELSKGKASFYQSKQTDDILRGYHILHYQKINSIS